MINDIEIAYIAGLIDGEGYLGVKKSKRKNCNNPSYQARIQIRMVDEPAIAFIADKLGGNYYREKPNAKRGKPLYCYQASDKIAERIIKTIYPYILVKKEVAKTVLIFCRLKKRAAKHRNKITGYRDFPNRQGKVRRVPNLSYSDKYIEWCNSLWLRCKAINKVGV